MPIRRIAANDPWFEAFESAAEIVRATTGALVAACATDRLPYDLLARSKVFQARANLVLLEVHERLDESFITSLEREDIHRMTTSFVDIVETLTAAVGRMDAFGIDRPTEPLRQFLTALDALAAALAGVVTALRTLHPAVVTAACAEVDRLAAEVDEVYREIQRGYAMQHADARDLLRWKDVYDRLERAAVLSFQVVRVARHVLMRHS